MRKNPKETEKEEALRLAKIEAAKAAVLGSKAASLLGRLGGMSGRGESKARPPEVCRAAVMKRWDAYRKEKMSRRKIRAD